MMYYSASMNTLDESLMNAVKEGKLLESSRTKIRLLLDGTKSPRAREAVEELAAAGEWQEPVSYTHLHLFRFKSKRNVCHRRKRKFRVCLPADGYKEFPAFRGWSAA